MDQGNGEEGLGATLSAVLGGSARVRLLFLVIVGGVVSARRVLFRINPLAIPGRGP